MILECPHCNARLNAAVAPAPGTAVRCSKCKQVFHPIPMAETAQEPLTGSDDSDWSNVAASPAVEPEAKPARKAQQSGKKFPIIAVGGGVLVIIALVVVIVVFVFGEKPKPNPSGDTNTANSQPTPPKKDNASKKDSKTDAKSLVRPQIPAEYVELLRDAADRPIPSVQLPVLKKVGSGELAVAAFANKSEPASDPGKMSIDEIKKSTTFIIQGTAEGIRSTGSGFVIKADRESILVATNNHVISSKSGNLSTEVTKIAVVFDSGTPNEHSTKAEIIVRDPEVDLAILKIRPFENLPKPIGLTQLPKTVEAMDVVCFGFPLGFALASEGRRPSISVTKGSVSNLQQDKAGKLSEIRIIAGIRPGNSGGPVVDNDGRLIGIVKSYFEGSTIHNIIPAAELVALLAGRVYPPSVLPVVEDEGEPTFLVEAPISDPLKFVKDVILHVWIGENPPELEKEPGGKWKAIPGAEKITLTIGARRAEGRFKLPQPPSNKKPTVLLQLECISQSGEVVISPPTRHQLIPEGTQTAFDAIPLSTFQKNLTRYSGQSVVIRARLSPRFERRGAAFELQVIDDADASPSKLTFIADREVATQLSELPPTELSSDLRLTLRVGKQAANSSTPVRITKVDFVSLGNRLSKTIPSTVESNDPLIGLNRAPEKFVGQTIPFVGYLSSTILGTDKEPELAIMLLSEQQPVNLHFTSSPALATKLKDQDLSKDSLQLAKITVRVEPRFLEGTGAQIVTVTKIELPDKEGKTGKTIE